MKKDTTLWFRKFIDILGLTDRFLHFNWNLCRDRGTVHNDEQNSLCACVINIISICRAQTSRGLSHAPPKRTALNWNFANYRFGTLYVRFAMDKNLDFASFDCFSSQLKTYNSYPKLFDKKVLQARPRWPHKEFSKKRFQLKIYWFSRTLKLLL